MNVMDDKLVEALVKTLEHHQKMLELLSMAIADHAVLIVPQLEKCSIDSCDKPATVEDSRSIKLCDRCCAERAKQDHLSGRAHSIDVALRSWLDLPVARAVRSVSVHRDIIVESSPECSRVH